MNRWNKNGYCSRSVKKKKKKKKKKEVRACEWKIPVLVQHFCFESEYEMLRERRR